MDRCTWTVPRRARFMFVCLIDCLFMFKSLVGREIGEAHASICFMFSFLVLSGAPFLQYVFMFSHFCSHFCDSSVLSDIPERLSRRPLSVSTKLVQETNAKHHDVVGTSESCFFGALSLVGRSCKQFRSSMGRVSCPTLP